MPGYRFRCAIHRGQWFEERGGVGNELWTDSVCPICEIDRLSAEVERLNAENAELEDREAAQAIAVVVGRSMGQEHGGGV